MHTLPVAVVIPAYNAERSIAEALESVCVQMARPAEIIVRPAEIIVVNDGSTDRTAVIEAAG